MKRDGVNEDLTFKNLKALFSALVDGECVVQGCTIAWLTENGDLWATTNNFQSNFPASIHFDANQGWRLYVE